MLRGADWIDRVGLGRDTVVLGEDCTVCDGYDRLTLGRLGATVRVREDCSTRVGADERTDTLCSREGVFIVLTLLDGPEDGALDTVRRVSLVPRTRVGV